MGLRILYAVVGILLLVAGWQYFAMKRSAESGMIPPPQTVTAEDAAQTLPGLTVGPADADVTVIEFLDYRCPACRYVHPIVQQAIAENPDVRFVFRHLPVFGKDSVNEAQLAITAARKGRFMDAHEKLMAREEPAGEDGINSIITELGFAVDSFREEMRQPGNAEIMLKTVDASETLGIASTPTFVVNGTLYTPAEEPMTIHDLRRLIAAARGQVYEAPAVEAEAVIETEAPANDNEPAAADTEADAAPAQQEAPADN